MAFPVADYAGTRGVTTSSTVDHHARSRSALYRVAFPKRNPAWRQGQVLRCHIRAGRSSLCCAGSKGGYRQLLKHVATQDLAPIPLTTSPGLVCPEYLGLPHPTPALCDSRRRRQRHPGFRVPSTVVVPLVVMSST